MFDAGIRIVSLVFVSGILLFLTFFLWSLLFARKASAASPPLQPVGVARDYGYLTPVARPLEWTLRQAQARVTYRTGRSSWGWAIIATTFLVNLILLPFRVLAARNARTMRGLQPELEAIHQRYQAKGKSSRMRMDPEHSREISDLYRRHKTHPLSGCIPGIGPLLILAGLYRVLAQVPELHGAGWLWIADLARPEQLPVRLLPILLIATQWLMGRTAPSAPADPQMNRLMQWMPLLGILFYGQPSMLMLYWVTSNALALGQQWWLARRYA